MLLKEQLVEEIRLIPEEKLAEVYDLIHYFRLGLCSERQALEIKQRTTDLAQGTGEIPSVGPLVAQKQFPEKKINKGVRIGSLTGKGYSVPDDFDEPLDDLKDYMW